MRNKHTSKQTSKRSTHTFCRIFGIFSTSISKVFLDAQMNEYNKKLSTTPNAYDKLQDNKNQYCTITTHFK